MSRLLKEGHDVRQSGTEGWTLLHYAAFQGTPTAVTLLIEHGADVNARAKDGPTPLQVAENKNREDIVKILRTVK
ncbi:MAG: ankyrin repeat domain-containing protein [Planctomycetota bacterium]|nr:ankyrin repeat domain-containing protein [Planctomycetota bacterium]